MRPSPNFAVSQSGAIGNSPWLVLDYLQRPFNVALYATLSFNGTLTYSVQHTPDNPNVTVPATISRAGTVATLSTQQAHGLSVGDAAVVVNSGDPNLDGNQAVATVVNATSFTYNVANTGALAGLPSAAAALLRVFNHATMTGLTARAAGNYAYPTMATRVVVTAWTAGGVTLSALQGHARG
jgi:hypothetical protein